MVIINRWKPWIKTKRVEWGSPIQSCFYWEIETRTIIIFSNCCCNCLWRTLSDIKRSLIEQYLGVYEHNYNRKNNCVVETYVNVIFTSNAIRRSSRWVLARPWSPAAHGFGECDGVEIVPVESFWQAAVLSTSIVTGSISKAKTRTETISVKSSSVWFHSKKTSLIFLCHDFFNGIN